MGTRCQISGLARVVALNLGTSASLFYLVFMPIPSHDDISQDECILLGKEKDYFLIYPDMNAFWCLSRSESHQVINLGIAQLKCKI